MDETVERVSILLVAAHRGARQIGTPPAHVGPLSLEDAYAIQDRVALELGGVGGWKTGAPSPNAEPIAAPLLRNLIRASPAVLPAARFHALGVEAELAFRFERPLAPRTRPYSRDEVIATIGSLHTAIEIVDSRLGTWGQQDAMWKLADNQVNGYFVYGPPATNWQRSDLAHAPVRLEVDDRTLVSHDDGSNPAGDPLRLATWLANHLAATRSGLKAGDIVTTGSCTGLIWVRPGQRVVARFPGLGEASVEFVV